jgi:thiol-disulfide isomerase/thioredoxin
MPPVIRVLLAGMTAGVIALLAALVGAVAGGAAWRSVNGRMRGKPLPGRAAAGQGADGAAAYRAAGLGSADGSRAAGPGGRAADRAADRDRALTSKQLGQQRGARATLVQFSSAFCAPCRATRRILSDVASMTDGVAHIEIDAESRLDLVRELNVLRTPTVLVLAADGRVVRRASGQPRKPDVIAAIGEAVRA